MMRIIFTMIVILSSTGLLAEPIEENTQPVTDVTVESEVPFPWGSEIPFPWRRIDGIWKGVHSNYSAVFDFEPISGTAEGVRLLVVKQLDPVTNEVIAVGKGVEVDRIVRAQMVSILGNSSSYRVVVRAYYEKKGAIRRMRPVLSVLPLDGAGWTAHFVLQKLQGRPGNSGFEY